MDAELGLEDRVRTVLEFSALFLLASLHYLTDKWWCFTDESDSDSSNMEEDKEATSVLFIDEQTAGKTEGKH